MPFLLLLLVPWATAPCQKLTLMVASQECSPAAAGQSASGRVQALRHSSRLWTRSGQLLDLQRLQQLQKLHQAQQHMQLTQAVLRAASAQLLGSRIPQLAAGQLEQEQHSKECL